MKHIYLVRHGETAGNKGGYWQGDDEPLNETGLNQAEVVAQRVTHLDFDAFFVSPLLRTKQTAAAITAATSKEPELLPLVREYMNPTSVTSDGPDPEKDVQIEEFKAARKANEHDPDWCQEDGESARVYHKRIEAALKFLREHEADNILVVSHGHFIRTLTKYVVMGEPEDPLSVVWKKKTMSASNTGITVFEVDGENIYLKTFNDHAHFAD